MKTKKEQTVRSGFGKIVSMKRTKEGDMIVSVEINFFSPSPKLYTSTKKVNIEFSTSNVVTFKSKYEGECMDMLEKYTDDEIKSKSNKIAEKYFTGKIMDEIASDIFGKTSIISAYPVRI